MAFVEQFEPRRLLSATVVDGIVIISTDDTDNIIELWNSSKNPSQLIVHDGQQEYSLPRRSIRLVRINSAGGNDTLIGGKGDDLIFGGEGHDKLFGGEDKDTLHGDDVTGFVNATIGGLAFGNGIAIDRVSSDIEGIVGTKFADVITGDDNANILFGNGGRDLINGDEGNDTIHGGGGIDTIMGDSGSDIFSAVERQDEEITDFEADIDSLV